jgi:hypothetical protein
MMTMPTKKAGRQKAGHEKAGCQKANCLCQKSPGREIAFPIDSQYLFSLKKFKFLKCCMLFSLIVWKRHRLSLLSNFFLIISEFKFFFGVLWTILMLKPERC